MFFFPLFKSMLITMHRDEFKALDWQAIYEGMHKPAFVFDGRLILDRAALTKIGFRVETIGRGKEL